jgi:DNA-binding NtrC family response regulator
VAWPTYPRWARTEGILSYYAAPLLRGDQLLGVLATFHRHRFLDPYAHEAALLWTQALAELLADAVSGAREQARDEEHVSRLAREHAYLRGAEREAGGHGPVLGRSSATGRLRNQIDVAARTEAPVLILGEPGTGRELAARVIHDRSARSLRPLVRLDAAEPGLGETELADHLALAAGSTLLVRNAHLLPHALQLAVLREAEAVEAVPERARIVATAFPELRDSVETGRFDPDLFHRLAVVVIEIVPLRHRPEDVPDLAQHFAAQAARRAGRVAPALSPADRKALQAKPWTGNVWELRLTVERAVAGSGTGPFRLEPVAAPPPAPASEAPILTEAELRTLARENTMRALEAADWKVAGPKGAAALLGLRPTTLAARMKAMGMVRTRKGK